MAILLNPNDIADMLGVDEQLIIRFLQRGKVDGEDKSGGEYWMREKDAQELGVDWCDGNIIITYYGHKLYEEPLPESYPPEWKD